MLSATSSIFTKTNQEITHSAIEDLPYAKLVLSQERIFERLSYEQVLTIIASHEELALGYLQNPKHWSVPDGLALSILAERSEKVALYVIKTPEFRRLLNGVDLARMGKSSAIVAMAILQDEELRTRLKSVHLAMLGENQPKIADFIAANPSLFSVDPNDLGKLCKSNFALAKHYFSDEAFVKKCDGSTIALMVEMHSKLIDALLDDVNKDDKVDSQALVVLGRFHESIALKIYQNSKYCARLGPFGIARLLKHHPSLAMQALDDTAVCAEFNGACYEQLAESDEKVALRIYNEHKADLSLDESVMIAKNSSSLALQLLSDPLVRPLLSGKNLVSLGVHPQACDFILANADLRAKALKFNIGLMGLKNITHANMMVSEEDLKENLQQLDLANLCKNFLFITQLTLNDTFLQSKISSSYLELLQQRMKTVISLATYVQRNLEQSVIESFSQLSLGPQTPYSFPQMSVTTAKTAPLPVPAANSIFCKHYQSLFM